MVSKLARLFIAACMFLSLRVSKAPIIGRVIALLAEFSLAMHTIFYMQCLTFSLDIENWYASFNNTMSTSSVLISALFGI